MINLIPAAAKKQIIREYWVRVISVWLILLTVACIVLVTLLVPTYLLLRQQIDLYSQDAETAIAEANKHDLSAASLILASKQAVEIINLNDEITFSSLLSLFSSLPNTGVKLTAYEFRRQDDKIGPVVLNGTADTRQALATFRKKLLSHPRIEKIELPISNLALDKNISFSVTVTLRPDSIQ